MTHTRFNTCTPSADWLTDPEVYAVHRLPAHSNHEYTVTPVSTTTASTVASSAATPSTAASATSSCAASPQYANANPKNINILPPTVQTTQQLDGTWQVTVVPARDITLGDCPTVRTAHGTAVAFTEEHLSAYDNAALALCPVTVPGHLQTAGLLPHQYVNIQYPWDGHEDPQAPYIPANNHVAIYRRQFTLAPDLNRIRANHGTVTLTFHGMATAIYVWINGVCIGYSEDGYTPSEFDITAALHAGKNTLTVACYEYASASWLEDQDFWRLHGLFRSVQLQVQPYSHITHMKIDADYDAAKQCGHILADIQIRHSEQVSQLNAYLIDYSGHTVWQHTITINNSVAQQRSSITLNSDQLANIKPWSAESPTLYTLKLTLVDINGIPIEHCHQRIGFRRFEIIDGIMQLNGKRIVFKGVNRHEFNAHRGRAIARQNMIDDIVFCKQHNINAIRTSHYPNSPEWYDLCDEYGLYILDETNLETHGSWSTPTVEPTTDTAVPGSLPQWQEACVDRLHSMMMRDYNHPCVLIWSLGNESYAGDVFRAMYQHAHTIDPRRPVHYEGATHYREYDDVSDIETRMYAHADDITAYLLENPTDTTQPKKPYLSCEYMHAMGNSVGNLDEYTALEQYTQYQGGFIWDFIDQALFQQQPDGSERLCYGGDFQDRPTDYEFSGNGLLFADRTPSPKAQEVKQLYANVHMVLSETQPCNSRHSKDAQHTVPAALALTLTNTNIFTNTANYRFVASILADGMPVWEHTYAFAVDADSTGTYILHDLPLAHFADQAQELVVEVSQQLGKSTLWASAGYELSFCQWIYNTHQSQQAIQSQQSQQPSQQQPQQTQQLHQTQQLSQLSAQSDTAATITVGRWNAGLRANGREILFSRTQGGLVSYTYRNREFVLRAPSITTFRALTDNDRGAGHGFERAQWLPAGRYARCTNTTIREHNGMLEAQYTYVLAHPARIEVTLTYTALPDGQLHIHLHYPGYDDTTVALPTIPAFGLQWKLPVEYSNLQFYGYGPQETYADRNHAKLGIWQRTAYEDCAPYLVPQETGNHEGVRWASITDQQGHGLHISRFGASPFAFSVLPYSSMMLEEAMHQEELAQPHHMYMRLLAAQMGVGGDDSWMSPVHAPYQISPYQPLDLDVIVNAQ